MLLTVTAGGRRGAGLSLFGLSKVKRYPHLTSSHKAIGKGHPILLKWERDFIANPCDRVLGRDAKGRPPAGNQK